MKAARGFSLLEILVALTLFAVVGGTLLQLFQSGLRTTRIATEQTHAAFLARSKLAELQAFNQLSPGNLQGEFDNGYRWQVELTPAVPHAANSLLDMHPLVARVSILWGEPGDGQSLVVDTLLLSAWQAP